MPVPVEEGGVVVEIRGTSEEVRQLNDRINMDARQELAGLFNDDNYMVTVGDLKLFGRGCIPSDLIELWYANLLAALKAGGTLDVDMSRARRLSRLPERDSRGRPTGRYIDTRNPGDAIVRLGELIAHRDELSALITSIESRDREMDNLRFGLDFIDFATAVVAMKKAKILADQ